MGIKENYLSLLNDVKNIALQSDRSLNEIAVVGVSKTRPVNEIIEAYQAGCRDFGENRVQEALDKIPQLPEDARWHFIGTLQKNKVRKVIGQFALIHSVDDFELAQKISECSQEMNVITYILLQVNTSGEISKHGFSIDECKSSFKDLMNLPFLKVEGLMTMAPLTEDEDVIRACFAKLRILRNELIKTSGHVSSLKHLSMGMSHDYPVAISEGATLLRIGTAIFGNR